MGERQPAKHHSSLAAQASLFGAEGVPRERSWAGNPAIARALAVAAASTFCQSGGAPSAALFYRRCTGFYDAFLARRAAQPNTRRHSAYKHTYLKAQRCFQDSCAKNKADICGSALPITRKE